jgi:hypothetical protein
METSQSDDLLDRRQQGSNLFYERKELLAHDEEFGAGVVDDVGGFGG